MEGRNNLKELDPWTQISIKVRRGQLKRWDDERKRLKSNPDGETPSRSEFIRDRMDESFEPIDVIAARKLLRFFQKKEVKK